MSEENEKRAAGSPEEPATPEAPTQPVAPAPQATAQPTPPGEAPQPTPQPEARHGAEAPAQPGGEAPPQPAAAAPGQPAAEHTAAVPGGQPTAAQPAAAPTGPPPAPRPKRLRGFAKRKSVQLVAVALLGAVVGGGVVGFAGGPGGHRHGHEFAKYGGGDRPDGRFERGPGPRFEVPDRFDR
ncbi:hypothetical protein M8C13_28560 [Crossiella sp. SN42]|uniref:hypothetical protein n=1 Tax=Crossiella sp. SN42 TaxID=2944808 RepID=UPI00207C4169|nr:hypothetical protein [Crossiella sp. SN42]MCO1579710.1 hypothetical protein [Crossiella sp. SN42]